MKVRIRSLCAFAIALAVIGAVLPRPAAAKIPVVLDTDIGDDIDDTWALALLLRSPDLDLRLVTTEFGKVGLMICWDVQFSDPARALALRGAEILLVPIWGGNPALGKARAIENQVFLVSSGYNYPTYVLDPKGETLAQAAE